MNPAIQWISIRDIKCTFQGRANLSSGKRYPPVEHLGLVLQRNSTKKLSFLKVSSADSEVITDTVCRARSVASI